MSHKSDPVVKHQLKKVGPSRTQSSLSRRGHPRMMSNWHKTSEEAFEYIRAKCISMHLDVPSMSHTRSAEPGVAEPGVAELGVECIHQVYGLQEMSALSTLSSSAWKAYATRNQCQYKLWTADQVEALIQLEAPAGVQTLYRDVRFPVQQAHVARFFILFMYGGLYADLDVFPNLGNFPQVPLGLCKGIVTTVDFYTTRENSSGRWML